MIRNLSFLFALLLINCIKAQVNNGLISKFSFNQSSIEDEQRGKKAIVLGASFVDDRFGNPNSSVYLHGNHSSYINLGTDSILKPSKGSISMWVNIELIMLKGTGWDYNPILLTKSHAGDDYYEGYFIGLNFNSYRLNVTTSIDQEHQITVNSNDLFALRKWHHLVLTYDDDFLSLFIDNKLETKMPKKFKSHFLAGDSIMIGNSANIKNQRYLCGTIDDIQIFNRVLSEDEVSELYNAPNPNINKIYLNYFLIFISILFGIALLVWLFNIRYRQIIQKEKDKNDMNAKLNALETRAIRIQMNPHFMFNSLNALQAFILDNDMENAHLYLTKFSKLLRKLLESSSGESVSLKEEIEILNGYLEIEKLRFENSFEYHIENNIHNPDEIYIPLMMVQPFVENAIWHGLLPKSGERKLDIHFLKMDENRLLCIIDDNGVGRNLYKKKTDQDSKKSMAIEFITQRLELIQKSIGTVCSINIIDKKDAFNQSIGTKVELIMPLLKK